MSSPSMHLNVILVWRLETEERDDVDDHGKGEGITFYVLLSLIGSIFLLT